MINSLLTAIRPYLVTGLACLVSALTVYQGWKIFRTFTR